MLSGGADVVRAPGVSPLYDVNRQRHADLGPGQIQASLELVGNLFSSHMDHVIAPPKRRGNRMVEPDGIEPTT